MDVTSLLNTATAVHREEERARETNSPAGQTFPPSTPDQRTTHSSTHHSPSPEKSLSRRTSESKTPIRNRTPWDANGYALPLLNVKSTEVSVQPIFCSDSPVESVSPKSPMHKFSDSHSSLSSYSSSSTSLSHSRISSMSTAGSFQTMSTIPDVSSLEIGPGNVDLGASKGRLAEHMARRGGILSPSVIAEEPSSIGTRRPGSPSDAMLMLRGPHSLDRMSPPNTSSTKHLTSDHTYLVPPDLVKAHKRAISAPDFAALNPTDRTFLPLLTTLQPTPPPSHQGDRRPSYAMDTSSASPINDGSLTQDKSLVCLYVDNCDTNSALRKAISHIFGRNKLCTRTIPQHVWVHFCRKHYQRSRYRNAQEYAKLQCDLVQKQVRRVQNWSDENQRTGQTGILQDWSLSMRKREQNRVQDKSKKRPYRDESGEEEEEEEDGGLDRAILNGTAVPDWLRNKCGSGYTTTEIEEIVARLKEEMEANNLTQIPDIEILPSISSDTADDTKPKMVLRRKASAGTTHRRSQSVGVASQARSSPMTRRISQPSEDNPRPSPVEKRQRTSETSPYSDHHGRASLSSLPENHSSSVTPAMRPMYQLPHRPAFQHIHENRTEEAYFDEQDGRGSHYNYSGPLPAPMPQRPLHNRSHSEIGGFQATNFTFQSTLSRPQGYIRDEVSYDREYVRELENNGPRPYYDAQSPLWPAPYPRHSRNLSTPNVPQITVPRLEYDHSPPRSGVSYESTVPYNLRQHSFASPRQYNHRAGTQETDQTRALYEARR
ncbi:hypothetical protein F5X99DRAFT_145013 [Biscogniauxia marginata]|nr:hypothetical protein F5X99DRAFT_145013 [Biscogniauxia marginata]